MNQFETEVQARLNDAADQVDPRGEQRVLRRTERDAAARRLRSAGIAMIAGVAATFAVIGGLSLTVSSDDAPSADDAAADVRGHVPLGEGADYVPLVKNLGDRCPGAVAADNPSELQALTEAKVAAPSIGRLADAWACGTDGVLWYSNGVQVSFTTGWSKVDVPAKWELRVKEDGGRVEMIGGLLAYVAAAEGDATRNVVAMVKGDTLISLVSEKNVPLETSVEMAKTIDLE